MQAQLESVGVVAIGRNEGDRLKHCLQSALDLVRYVVYVDSGSNDGSVEFAHSLGVEVVILDLSKPFTAGRARNRGFQRLREIAPHVELIQFVDGDCEIVSDWLNKATHFMNANDGVSVVCGRRRERYPNSSIYNLLCDIEWDTPAGETKACGGDALIRVAALEAVAGFRDDLIAGEEPELCIRLRKIGRRIWRLNEEMSIHDAAMSRFGQWWKRAMRYGHALGEGVLLHGAPPERHWVRESLSSHFWAIGIPLLALAATSWAGYLGFILLLAYPIQYCRVVISGRRSPRENRIYALFVIVGKFAEALGQLRFYALHYLGSRSRLIEYK